MADAQLAKVSRLLGRIRARLFETRFHLEASRDKVHGDQGRIYIQARYVARDTHNGELKEWGGRKWYLSEFMTDDEIIKTAWCAFEAAVKHEAMEGFRVDGKILFNPHVDFMALLRVSGEQVHRTQSDAVQR